MAKKPNPKVTDLPMCPECDKSVDVTKPDGWEEVNAEGAYGRPRIVVHDACMKKSKRWDKKAPAAA